MTVERYRQTLHALSQRLIEIQKPILILDALKWPTSVRERFFAQGERDLPDIGIEFYRNQPPRFDSKAITLELKDLEQTIVRQLGDGDELATILLDTCRQYRRVVALLQSRGTAEFLDHSRALYGSARDHLAGGDKTLVDLSEKLCAIFTLPGARHLNQSYPKTLSSEQARLWLSERLAPYFGENMFSIKLDDGIVSDASAGGDTLKIKAQALFSERALKVLEVHEGWVHLGTTLNGRAQPWATWLSIGSPRVTATQEGLAVLIETLTFNAFPERARRLSDRVLAVDMAERGADFLEVYRHFRAQDIAAPDCFTLAQRAFRGGCVEGGACFTKDTAYVRGFIDLVNFMRGSALAGVPEILPMLFVGKLALTDIPALYRHALAGTIIMPKFLPPMFSDINGLYVWMGFASGIAHLDIDRVEQHYQCYFNDLPRQIEKPAQDIDYG